MTFDDAFDRLMINEGGEVNNPNDPGGHTKYGISQHSYPNEDISAMTKERAKVIFKRDFWDRVHAENLFDGVAWQAADFAYNSGPETAVRYLQRALGVADDGHWGPISQAAADASDESDTIMLLLSERLQFMTRLSNWNSAGKGWALRIAQDLRYGATDS
jgi:lysozyme family protein